MHTLGIVLLVAGIAAASAAAAAEGTEEVGDNGAGETLQDTLHGIPEYAFTRYPFKKKSRGARLLRGATRDCERQCDMADEQEYIQLHCVRSCISQECYNEVYGADPLEPGEIDIRKASFSGCASVRLALQAQSGAAEDEISDEDVGRTIDG